MATFLLVHGTFAKSAHWPALQEGITEEANEAGETASFEQLAWSGKNRAVAREAAASAILKSVQNIRSNSNNEKIFLIGHSHGGSAIAYFLKEHTEVAKMLSGCAFLSTPFVAIRPRNQTILKLSAVFALMVACYLWVQYIGRWGGVGGVLIIILLGIGLWHLGAFNFHSLQKQIIRQQTTDIPPGNYFFTRCSGDEAAAALSAVQFINWLNMKASKIVAGKGNLGVSLITFTVFALLLASALLWPIVGAEIAELGVFGFCKFLIWGLIHEPTIGSIYFLLILFIVSGSCLFVLCSLLVFFTFMIQALTSRAFGWTALGTGFLVELAIEPLPFGNYSLVNVDWSDESTGSKELSHRTYANLAEYVRSFVKATLRSDESTGSEELSHSWTYANPTAIKHLRDWVKGSLVSQSLPAHHPSPTENFQPQELQPVDAF